MLRRSSPVARALRCPSHQQKQYTATAQVLFEDSQLEPAGLRASDRQHVAYRRSPDHGHQRPATDRAGGGGREYGGTGGAGSGGRRHLPSDHGLPARPDERRERFRNQRRSIARGPDCQHVRRAVHRSAAHSPASIRRAGARARRAPGCRAIPRAACRDNRAGAARPRRVAPHPRETAGWRRPVGDTRQDSNVAVIAEGQAQHRARRAAWPPARTHGRLPARATRPPDEESRGPRGDLSIAATGGRAAKQGLCRGSRSWVRQPPTPRARYSSCCAPIFATSTSTARCRSLLVVSAAPGDGKTTIARNLAQASQETGSRTLLLEADLRRPTIAAHYGVDSAPGLSELLVGAVGVDAAIRAIPIATRVNGSTTGVSLDLLPAGHPPPNPAELLESHAMADLLVVGCRALRAGGHRHSSGRRRLRRDPSACARWTAWSWSASWARTPAMRPRSCASG